MLHETTSPDGGMVRSNIFQNQKIHGKENERRSRGRGSPEGFLSLWNSDEFISVVETIALHCGI